LILSGVTEDLDQIGIEITAEEIFPIIKNDLIRVKGEIEREIAEPGNEIFWKNYLKLRWLKLSEQPIIDSSFLTKL
jgi:hypothetical protein